MLKESSDVLVFFGATGDLAYKQIFPALQGLVRDGQLDVPVIGLAHSGWTLDRLKDRARASLEAHGGVDEAAFAKLSSLLRYVDGDYADPATFTRLKAAMGGATHPLHYLAIPPVAFGLVVENLAASSCATGARIVVEKPFGRDLKSALALSATLHDVFPESAVFRIDHYLGKEAVQNLLYFRFANSFLEPIWNRTHIDRVQVTMAEEFGVEGRGRFYDDVGAIRDVVQNHLLQVVAMLAMEPPVGHDPDSIRDAKGLAFKAMTPLSPDAVVRGQFKGYRNEPGVAADSEVETFAGVRLEIDSWRWAGVPFCIRTGKRLAVTCTEVLIELKYPPQAIFDDVRFAAPNHFRFQLSPHVLLELGARAKRAGEAFAGEDVNLVACHEEGQDVPPYQRLLGDALRGDQTLFAREDAVLDAWRVVDPVLGNVTPIFPYDGGGWGPAEADAILGGGKWHEPAPEGPKG
jgi:glucose-6-phosphate 1-dehydrogenase